MVRPVLLLIVLVAGVAGCASRGGVPRPFPGAQGPSEPVASADSATTARLIATALSYRGIPYRNGGSDPSGFDCSGFVQWVFAQHGLALPREVRQQFDIGHVVDRGQVQAGDLVFFETVSRGPSHVGIALGADQFVHAPSSRGVVRVENYSTAYWQQRYLGARRME